MSLRYSKNHCWIKKTDNSIVVGISDYACKQICNNFILNLPDEDEEFRAGDVVCDIESCKYFEVISPVNGKILKVNDSLLYDASSLLSDPYDSWLFEMTDVAFTQELLSATEYADYLTML
ncbi:MAG: glycine cleavage system protein H [Clostridia bacterium]|nr:glycine cleavage system protein H [Clostridia bacterium]